MAQYQITRSCGHVETEQIYGTNTRGERERQARRLAQQPCTTCRHAAYEQTNARAAEVAESAGWPPLSGSPKQTAWAQSIRVEAMATLADEAQRRARRAEQSGWSPQQAQALADLLTRTWQQAVLRQGSASWWISHRSSIVAAARRALTDADWAAYEAGVEAITGQAATGGVSATERVSEPQGSAPTPAPTPASEPRPADTTAPDDTEVCRHGVSYDLTCADCGD